MHDRNGLSLDHLDRLTDSTGLIQHAIYGIPRRESGYTTDDNARALRLCARLWDRQPEPRLLERVTRYLSFVEHAHREGRGFHNFMSYQRHWLDEVGTEDCQGQAVLALAEVLCGILPDDCCTLARELIGKTLPTLADMRSLRAQAYVILACDRLWASDVQHIEPLENIAFVAAKRLLEGYRVSQRPEWRWFESRMTYANAVLPHALFLAARRWPQEEFAEAATTSFAFLNRATTAQDFFWPVGNSRWYPHGDDKAPYDQQPVEASTMADAALAAWDWLADEKYLVTFHQAHQWFHGQNSLRQSLVDPRSGACCDGLLPTGVNRNQGAESTLAYLWTELRHREVLHLRAGERPSTVVSA